MDDVKDFIQYAELIESVKKRIVDSVREFKLITVTKEEVMECVSRILVNDSISFKERFMKLSSFELEISLSDGNVALILKACRKY